MVAAVLASILEFTNVCCVFLVTHEPAYIKEPGNLRFGVTIGNTVQGYILS